LNFTTIGEKVKRYRKDRGFSQDELADGICSRQTISLLENGIHVPSADILTKISERLGIPLAEIVKTREQSLNEKLQVDILKAYVSASEYAPAMELISELETRKDLPDFLRREVLLCKAECLLRTGEAEQAISLLETFQKQLEIARDPDDYTTASVYLKMGTAYYFLSDLLNAYTYYMRACQIAERLPSQDILTAHIFYNLGNVCRQINLDEQAVMYLTKAKVIYESYSSPKNLAHSLFALGIAYKNLNLLEQAETYLLQAQALYEAENITTLAQVAKQGYVFGVLAKKDRDQALQELLKSIPEIESAGDLYQLAYTYARISSLYTDLARLDDAETYIEKAVGIVEGNVPKVPTEYPFVKDPRIAFVYQVKAKYLYCSGEYEKCVSPAYKSAEMFGKMGLKSDAVESYTLSVEALEKQGRIEEALSISKELTELLKPHQSLSLTI
jgi:transcriptional regulator with XRE-family HTH domain